MRTVRTTFFTLVALSGVLVRLPLPAAAAPNSSVYWGAYVMGAPADMSLMDYLEAAVGKKASLEMMGQPWMRSGVYQSFPTAYLEKIRARGTIPVLDWASWDQCCGIQEPTFALATITSGAHDAYLIQWAQAAKAWGHPFFLRMDAEMNGWWRPWSEQTNGNHAGEFVLAWRHVVDLFRAQGATNVTWLWCTNIVGPRSTLTGLYPGDNYVDWTGMDGYNFGTDRANQWQTFNQVFGFSAYDGGFNTYELLLQTAPSKPIMIAETAASEHGGSKAAWITDMLTTQLAMNFPQIKAFVWFDWNENDPALSWPIESSPAAQSAFATGIASSYYATNEFASLATSPIPPLNPAPAALPPPQAGAITLNPVADTYTSRSAPWSTAGGTSTTLRSDVAGSDTAFMRFDLSSLAGKAITGATLRLRTSTEAWAGSAVPQELVWVPDMGWWEQYMSYQNTVPVSGLRLGIVNPVGPNTWSESAIWMPMVQATAGRALSIAVRGTSSDVLMFYSREAGAANAPQLVVSYR